MLTRQVFLLFVGAMHFVAIRSAITKKVGLNVRTIKNSGVCGAIHQTAMYKLLESVLRATGG